MLILGLYPSAKTQTSKRVLFASALIVNRPLASVVLRFWQSSVELYLCIPTAVIQHR